MPVEWRFPDELIRLTGPSAGKIDIDDSRRQEATARAILGELNRQPGIVLADEVGMGKTYVALAVVAAVLRSTDAGDGPAVVMVPPGLAGKWQREWRQFRDLYLNDAEKLRNVRDEFVPNATEFFKLLDDPPRQRARLIWMTTNCFRGKLSDGWIKLALVRLARRHTRMDEEMKKRLFKWAPELVRLKRHRELTPDVVERLLNADVDRWKDILVREGILNESEDDPVPKHLADYADDLKPHFAHLIDVLRGESIPGRRGVPSEERKKEARENLARECQELFEIWLRKVEWRSPLLVLDEAHHAKNDQSDLASLFRTAETERLVAFDDRDHKRPVLFEKFERMLFLTATPFQLGHHELVRVLRSFAAVRWSGKKAPERSRDEFLGAMNKLEERLDRCRLRGRSLDRLWGKLTLEGINLGDAGDDVESAVERWWETVGTEGRTLCEQELLRAVHETLNAREEAESKGEDRWATLRPWVVRHNRPTLLTRHHGGDPIKRREVKAGGSIAAGSDSAAGIPIDGENALPFLLAARAQGELAQRSSGSRAYFAEGLCSSFEAFHHTHKDGERAQDIEDEQPMDGTGQDQKRDPLVPVSWYEKHIEQIIPSWSDPAEKRLAHPKMQAVVRRVVDLWRSGEKVLVFCVYRETAKALREHLRREVENAVIDTARTKLGLPQASAEEIESWLGRIGRRLGDPDSPLHKTIDGLLRQPFAEPEFRALEHAEDEIVGLLSRYVRSPSFVARYLPLEVEEAWEARRGAEALRVALTKQEDASRTTLMGRVREFLLFATELVERRQVPVDDGEPEEEDPLTEYLEATGVCQSPARDTERDDDEDPREFRRRPSRPSQVVRMVYGDTKQDVRNRLMLAFNSPLFPEILVSSSVMGEGVDLHRFCRFVIHHDLCWNPSTLEQRTGRLDRIRCKAEVSGNPIVVYEPFIAGSADEKMFRVVRDRARWFQIVMGQKYELDEASSEELSRRVPLPENLARQLTFRLERYRRQE